MLKKRLYTYNICHLKEKKQYDLKYDIYNEELAIRNIVSLYKIRRETDMSRKLSFK